MTNPQSATTAVEYVLADVLGESRPVGSIEVGPYRGAFIAAGINNINDFLMLESEDFKDLDVEITTVVAAADPATQPSTPGATGSPSATPPPTVTRRTRRLTPVERRTLLHLRMWHMDFGIQNPVTPPVRRWFSLTRQSFAEWNSTYHNSSVTPASVGGGTRDSGTLDPTVKSETKDSVETKLLENYTRNIRRDESAFKVFKDEQYWLSFKRSLLVTARAQNVERIFDLEFDRSTLQGADKQLYEFQLKFGYSVLTRVVQTNQGRGYVRDHVHDSDATAVLREMNEYYSKSRAAEIAASELEVKITNLKFDSKWSTGAVAFLNYWKSLMFDLDEIRGEDNAVKIAQKKEWIIRSLGENVEMTNAVTSWNTTDRMMSESLSTLGQPPRTEAILYASIMAHLQTTAVNYDKKHIVARTSKRQAHRTDKKTILSSQYAADPGRIDDAKWATMSKADKIAHMKKRQAASKATKGKKNSKETRKDEINAAVKEALKAEREASVAGISHIPIVEVNTSSTTALGGAAATPVSSNSSPTLQSILACSNSTVRKTDAKTSDSKVTQVNNSFVTDASGHVYLKLSTAERIYHISSTGCTTRKTGSLIDRGANGGLGGDDMRVIEVVTSAKCDVTGITDNAVTDLDIVLGAGLLKSNRGPVVGLFPQYAYLGKGKTIHSCTQMEDWGIMVDEKPRRGKFPGKQRIETPDGYAFAIAIRNGLPYMDMSYPSDEDMENYPHVFFTRDEEWDPRVMDDEYSEFDNEMGDFGDDLAFTSPVNDSGEIILDHESEIDALICSANAAYVLNNEAVEVSKQKPKYDKLRPNFLWVSAERIKKTLAATTQFARSIGRIPFRKHFKTRWPAANVNRLNDDVATDTFFRTPRL